MSNTTEQSTPAEEMTAPAGMPELSSGVEDGIRWATVRAPLYGAVNGYARLPEGHPWRDQNLQSWFDEGSPDVHGGITYGPDADGWTGFDYLHGGDWWPGQATGQYPERRFGDEVLRTPAEVEAEAKSLARQVAASVDQVIPKKPDPEAEALQARLADAWDEGVEAGRKYGGGLATAGPGRAVAAPVNPYRAG